MQRLIAALFLIALATPAHARDVSGHLGIGGNYESGAIGGGLSFKYWVSDLGLHAFVGLDSFHSRPGLAGRLVFKPGIRVLYSMTRTRAANVFVGAGFSGAFGRGATTVPAKEGLDENGAPFESTTINFTTENFIDVVVGTEFFLGERFAIAGTVTLAFELGDASNPKRSLMSGRWGAAFHWYF